jgi:hypothetical protein
MNNIKCEKINNFGDDIQIVPPSTYAEWMELIELLKQKEYDVKVCEAMKKGTITWQKDIAIRFLKNLFEAINSRINEAVNDFLKIISRNELHENEIIQAMIILRKGFVMLFDLINISAIPEKERAIYSKQLLSHYDKVQSSLENLAQSDTSGRLMSIIKEYAINKL